MKNIKALARNYDNLTPEERFRLILASSARGDDAERDRLVNAGKRIVLSLQDHAPHARAFEELAFLVFIELLEEAARYLEAFAHADDASDILGDEEEEDEGEDEEEESGGQDKERKGDDADEKESYVKATSADEAPGERPLWQRFFDMALAAGYFLRAKADGWKLFCERMTVPPFALWEGFPGFDRLQRALKRAERAAFTSEGFLRWLNDIRPAGEPKRTEVPLTVDAVAAATEELFRKRVEWWGG